MLRLQTRRNASILTSRTRVRTRQPPNFTPVIRMIQAIRQRFSTLFQNKTQFYTTHMHKNVSRRCNEDLAIKLR